MSSKTLTGTYAAGYTITPPVTVLTIATTGYVEGNGVTTPPAGGGSYTVVNHGKVEASGVGVYLYSGGRVTNGGASDTVASIAGVIGVVIGEHAGTVSNFATIGALGATDQGVILADGGRLSNGSATDSSALILGAEAVGVYGATATIANFGTLLGTPASPTAAVVYLGGGGSVTNGAATHAGGLIESSGSGARVDGIRSKHVAATVANFGSIVLQNSGAGGVGVDLQAGGKVTNGAQGLIGGAEAVGVYGGAGVVSNLGTLQGVSASPTHAVVYLGAGGKVANGDTAHTAAAIMGSGGGGSIYGVRARHVAATVANFASIVVQSGAYFGVGVDLEAGGSVTNGSAGDYTAAIHGSEAIRALGAKSAIKNFGALYGYSLGMQTPLAVIYLGAGGSITNGSVFDYKARIAGAAKFASYNTSLVFDGVLARNQAANVTNFGSIVVSNAGAVLSDKESVAVDLEAGGTVRNATAHASIKAATGVVVGGATGTVVNFGSIAGTWHKSRSVAAYSQNEGDGVYLEAGGVVTNYAAISSNYSGVNIQHAAGVVRNFGHIYGAFGVRLGAGGKVTNGSATDTTALIKADQSNALGIGVNINGQGSVINFGTILGDHVNGPGVFFGGGGTVTNFGRIAGGHDAVTLHGSGYVLNLGQMYGAFGVTLGGGGNLVNGSATNANAVVDADQSGTIGIGINVIGSGTVTNFGHIVGNHLNGAGVVLRGPGAVINAGTISGGLYSVELQNASDVLRVEAGASFNGKVTGGHGTLDLDAGSGNINVLGGFAIVDYGLSTATSFLNFDTVQISNGVSLVSVGNAVTIGAGDEFRVQGQLSLPAFVNYGNIVISGGNGARVDLGTGGSYGNIFVEDGTLFTDVSLGNDFHSGACYLKNGLISVRYYFLYDINFTSNTDDKATLVLNNPSKFSNPYDHTVSGFSVSGNNYIDIEDYKFSNIASFSYVGNSTGGTLSIVMVNRTLYPDFNIKFTGNYIGTTWVLSQDSTGFGGTLISNTGVPSPTSASPLVTETETASAHAFVQAMAGAAASSPAMAGDGLAITHAPPLFLASPRAHLA